MPTKTKISCSRMESIINVLYLIWSSRYSLSIDRWAHYVLNLSQKTFDRHGSISMYLMCIPTLLYLHVSPCISCGSLLYFFKHHQLPQTVVLVTSDPLWSTWRGWSGGHAYKLHCSTRPVRLQIEATMSFPTLGLGRQSHDECSATLACTTADKQLKHKNKNRNTCE